MNVSSSNSSARSSSYMNRKSVIGLVLLFIISLTVSAVYHLPVSWLLTQDVVKSQIPPQVQLNQSQGSLWQGSSQLAVTSAKRPSRSTPFTHIGQVSWDLSLLSLLTTQISVDTLWKLESSQVSGTIVSELLSEKPFIKASELNGMIELPQLLKLSKDDALKAMPVKGRLELENLSMELDLQQSWPTQLQGLITIQDLDILGSALPAIEITPSVKGGVIDLKLSGKAEGWILVGNVTLLKNNQYRVNLKVVAKSPKQMPDWAALLKQQSPMVAVLNERGRW